MIKRVLGADGRLNFSKKFLKSLGIEGATTVTITTKGRDIIIKDCIQICALCSEQGNMIEGFPVCRDCAEKVADLLKLK